jgi:hypothetical protein
MSSPPVRAPLLLLAAAACLCSRPAFAQDIPNSIAGHELPKWVPPALATAFILVGLAELSIGYKFFRLTLFALGFLGAFLGLALPIIAFVASPAAPWIGLGVGGVAGLAVGVAGAMYPRVGVFLITAAAGVCVGLVLNTAFGWKIPIEPHITEGLLSAGTALVFGVLSTLFMRVMVILSTAVVGAFLVIYGVGRLVPVPNNMPDVLDLTNELVNGTLPGVAYAYLAGWAVLAVAGAALQFCYTSRKARGREAEKDEWERAVEDGGAGGDRAGKRGSAKRSKRARRGGGSGKKSASQRLKAQALLQDYDDGAAAYDEGGGAGDEDAGDDPSYYADDAHDGLSLPAAPAGRGGGGGGGGGGGWGASAPSAYDGDDYGEYEGGGGQAPRGQQQWPPQQEWARGPAPAPARGGGGGARTINW